MKKILALLLTMGLAISLVACGSSSSGAAEEPAADAEETAEAEEDTEEAAEAEEPAGEEEAETEAEPAGDADFDSVSIAIILSGSINDNGWNSAGYNAMKNITEKYGMAEPAYAENVATSDVEEYLRGYATQGYKFIVVHGSQYIDYVHNVAPEFPDSIFAISYADSDASMEPNVCCVGNIDSGFLDGYVAATLSKNGRVGFLGGEENPSITPLVDRFPDGAKFANPDVFVVTGYIGTLTDQDKAKEVAANMIAENDLDVISASANAAGLGVIEAAAEAGIMDVGFNSDQYEAAPDTVVVSVVRDFTAMYDNVIVSVADGTFKPQMYQFGIGTGTKITDWHGWDEKLDAEQVSAIEEFVAGCADGSIEY